MSSTTDRSHGLARKHIKGAIEDDERKAGGGIEHRRGGEDGG